MAKSFKQIKKEDNLEECHFCGQYVENLLVHTLNCQVVLEFLKEWRENPNNQILY